MKVVLLHPSFAPVIGGSESIMRQHAEILAENGHEVTVLTGSGKAGDAKYRLIKIEELSPSFDLNLKTKRAVDHGQTDGNLNDYTHLLIDKLQPHYANADVVITHGAVTTHFNLALTQAIWKLADSKPTIAWVHDLTAANKSYALPNPHLQPWSLMRTAHPKIKYVAISVPRQQELVEHLKLNAHDVPVIENGIDFAHLLDISPAFYRWLDKVNWFSRDFVAYYPTKILQRKNIDQAIITTEIIKKSGKNPLLLISGAPDMYSGSAQTYEHYIKALLTNPNIADNVYLLNELAAETGDTWPQAFRISDVLVFTSAYEGFGIPPYEAAMTKLPCWSHPLSTIPEWLAANNTFISTPGEALAAAEKLCTDPVHRARRKIRQEYNWRHIYQHRIEPLLKSLA
jgi:glycosyltransferase involved in cell wall biosynthesis